MENYSYCWDKIKSQGRWFYSSEEAAAETLRQLEEEVDSHTEVDRHENEISISGEASILVMDGIIPDSLINNITQRDQESSDESKDNYCIDENSD